jgi:hypothetical protein
MSLGSVFPPGLVKERIKAQLQPGTVVKYTTAMDDGEIHEKRFVVVDVSDDVLVCVINSRITQFALNRKHLLKCHVLMRHADHDYMSWDSHVDCTQIKRFELKSVINLLAEKPEWILGKISEDLRSEMVRAISEAMTIERILKRQCCESLNAANLTQ